jgi:putative SOS response-associated peptidase YedK
VNGDEDRRLFAFPGIWQRWNGPVKKDGPTVDLDVYSFMTTAPNALTDSINHERMPVLLSEEEDFETWLSGTPAEAFALARSFDPGAMRIVQSGKEKEDLLGRQSQQPSLL